MSLQIIWFVLVGVLLAGYAVLDGFDLGVGVLYPFVAHTDAERATLRSSIGPFWDGNEVWLLTAGGALFAAFPAVYATAFSGFYLAWILALAGLIFRAVAIEFRSKDPAWGRLWDWAFFGGSLLPALLYGVVVGNLVRGVPLDARGEYAGTLLSLFNPYALLIGVTSLVMFVTQGAAWASLRTAGPVQTRATRVRSMSHWLLSVLVAAGTAATLLVTPDHVRNNVSRPAGWIMVLLMVGGFVIARYGMAGRNDLRAFLGSSLSVLGLVGLWAVGSYPSLIPALDRPELSLTATNSSSSHLALEVMLIIFVIGLPLVLAYTALVYRSLSRP